MSGTRWVQGDAPDKASSRIVEAASPIVDSYTIPFLWIEDAEAGLAGQYGSGVLLEVSGRHFILTAAHTLDEVIVNDRPTYFAAAADNPVLAFGERRCVTTTMPESGKRYDDPIDLAVIDIDDLVGQLPADRRFLKLAQLDADPTDLIGGLYVAWGYPADPRHFKLNRTMLISASLPLGYVGVPAVHDPQPFHAFRPADHVAMEISDLSTDPNIVEPGGISGGGMWRLAQNGQAPDSWSEEDIRLVAIEHVWNPPTRTLSGTRIGHVANLIVHEWPALRSELAHGLPYRDGRFLSWQAAIRSPQRRSGTRAAHEDSTSEDRNRVVLGALDTPGEALAFRQLAQVDRWRGKTDEAFSNLNQSYTRYQRLRDVRGRLTIHLDRAELYQAVGTYGKALREVDTAIDIIKKLQAKKEHGIRARARTIRARIYMRRNRRADAGKDLEIALAVARGDARIAALVAKAEYHRRGFDLDKAWNLIEGAVGDAKLVPRYEPLYLALLERAEVLCLRGGGKGASEEFLEALTTLNECVSICSTTPNLSALANALFLRGKVRGALRREDAIQDWNHAIHVFDRFGDMVSAANVLFYTGTFCTRQGYYADARKAMLGALETYVAREVTDGRANVESALGDVDCLESNIAGALPHYTEAIRLYRVAGEDFGLSQALAQLACAQELVGALPEARAAATEAIQRARMTNNSFALERATGVLSRLPT